MLPGILPQGSRVAEDVVIMGDDEAEEGEEAEGEEVEEDETAEEDACDVIAIDSEEDTCVDSDDAEEAMEDEEDEKDACDIIAVPGAEDEEDDCDIIAVPGEEDEEVEDAIAVGGEEATEAERGMTNFVQFLKRAAHSQAGLSAGPVQFVPLAAPHLLPWDAHVLSCILVGRRVDETPFPVRPLAAATAEEKAVMLARISITVLGWTAPWARLASRLPHPFSAEHANALREKLLALWAKGETVMNPYLASSRCFAVKPDRKFDSTAAEKFDFAVAVVRGIMARAAQPACAGALASGDLEGAMRVICGSGIPFGGYLDKSARYLCRVLGVAESRASDAPCMGSGPCRGLARIVGGDPALYARDPGAARAALSAVMCEVQSSWLSVEGPAVALPVLHPWEISEMLCMWVSPYQTPQLMKGVGVPVRGQVPLQ